MNLHDKAFRQLMKEPGAVRSLVMVCLPKRLTCLIAGEPRAVSETYLEHPLRSAIADSVWELPLRGGATLTIFLVLEHKSRSNAKVAVQLGRYIVARRAGRADLAAAFVADVRAQHGSCPLYRSACLAFLPADQYPAADLRPEADPTLHPAARKMIASLN